MAMIFDIGIPRDEVIAIGNFLASEGEADLPEVSEEGAKVLNVLTSPGNANSLWRTVLGNFVEYTPDGRGDYLSPDGERVPVSDTLMDKDGRSTDRHGVVVADHVAPEAAYVIGVPL